MTTHELDRGPRPATPRSRRIAHANGVALCVEHFGDRSEPAVLLIMGASASMDWWEDEFCEQLAPRKRFVIRYDHRDAGQSTSYPPGNPSYTLNDLLEDAIRLLDTLAIGSAHLVGMSLGGAIAQLAAIEHPDRVASLTLISTSPGGPADSDLPSMSREALERFAVREPDWSDRAAVLDYITHLAWASSGDASTFDEAAFRQLAGRVVDRTVDIEASMTNHDLIDLGDSWRKRLRELSVPTLVIHGTEDPVLPYGHGVALAAEVPRGRAARSGANRPRATRRRPGHRRARDLEPHRRRANRSSRGRSGEHRVMLVAPAIEARRLVVLW